MGPPKSSKQKPRSTVPTAVDFNVSQQSSGIVFYFSVPSEEMMCRRFSRLSEYFNDINSQIMTLQKREAHSDDVLVLKMEFR